MLVLSRRANEEIVFPSLDITVSITHCTSKSVRLGIDAPRHIRIVRGELKPLDQTLDQTRSPKSQPLLATDFLTDESNDDQPSVEDIQNQIDTIKLAVQLAQTQLDHQREQRCQDALTYAQEAIAKLESSLATAPNQSQWLQTDFATEAVHEVRSGYHVGT